MDSKEAFDLLLAEVATAVEESLARYTAAIQKGDVDGMEVEQDRQRNLLATRNQLEVLQEMWVGLVGERKPPPKPKPARRSRRRRKLKRGQKTPQEAYVVPILHALEELGGSGTVVDVLDSVGALMAATLKDPDLEVLPSGRQIRWRNTAQWARNRMVEEGLLGGDSPRGIWEITTKGRSYLREHGKELEGLKRASRSSKAKLSEIPIEGLPVYARYKGRRYEATLFRDERMRYGGKEYGSPSGAGKVAIGYETLNGWRFWRYLDDRGEEHFITNLRD